MTETKDRWPEFLQFAEDLIVTGDLDPVYHMVYQGLQKGVLSEAQALRWILSYWFFYHSGVSSRVCTLGRAKFWESLQGGLKESPRGTERRHFRGPAAEKALSWFSSTYPDPVDAILALRPYKSFPRFSSRVREWPLFGPWIAFKAADMCERILGYEIDFSDCDLAMYSSPLQGAKDLDPSGDVKGVVARALRGLDGTLAPPRNDRQVNLQEAETCLCKAHALWNGTYWLGKDIYEVRHHHLPGWGPIADALEECLPADLPRKGVKRAFGELP